MASCYVDDVCSRVASGYVLHHTKGLIMKSELYRKLNEKFPTMPIMEELESNLEWFVAFAYWYHLKTTESVMPVLLTGAWYAADGANRFETFESAAESSLETLV